MSGDVLTFVDYPLYSRKGILARLDSSVENECVMTVAILCDQSVNGTVAPDFDLPVLGDCMMHIIIRSPYACRACGVDDYTTEQTSCINGKRNVTTKLKTPYCLGEVKSEVRYCQIEVTVLTSWIIFAIVGASILLVCIIVLIVVLVVRNRRIYGKYQKLVIATDTGDAFTTQADDDDDDSEYPSHAPPGNPKDGSDKPDDSDKDDDE